MNKNFSQTLKSDIADFFVCPSCKKSLDENWRCENCSIAFQEDEGTPVLIDKTARRQVSFPFTQSRSTVQGDFLSTILKDPPVVGFGEKMPYHMDRAHAWMIDAKES
jgi:rubredoxin